MPAPPWPGRDVIQRKVRQYAVDHVQVRRADPGGIDTDEHFARSKLRYWDVLHRQLTARAVEARSAHSGLSHQLASYVGRARLLGIVHCIDDGSLLFANLHDPLAASPFAGHVQQVIFHPCSGIGVEARVGTWRLPWSPKTNRSFLVTRRGWSAANCSSGSAGKRLHSPSFPDRHGYCTGRRRCHTNFLIPRLLVERETKALSAASGRIHRLIGHRDESDAGDDVDKVPVALLAHARQHGADAVKQPIKIQSELLLPILIRQFVERPAQASTGIIEKDIDTPAELGGLAESFPNVPS